VVILPNLSGVVASGAPKGAVRVGWSVGPAGLRLPSTGVASAARVLMDEEEAERQREEEIRVLYVAMTRPRERLLLLGSGQWRGHSFSAMLDRAACLSRRCLALGSGESGKAVGSSRRRRSVRLPGAREVASAWERRRKAKEGAESKPLFTHPSLATGDGPSRNFRTPKPKGPDPILLGGLCHEVLERWDYKRRRPIDPAAGESLKELLAWRSKTILKDVPAAEAKEVRREAHELLGHFLKSRTASLLAGVEILGRELPVLFEEDGIAVRGTIDLLYREKGKMVVADYKTDRIGAKERRSREKKYARQGSLYVKAVERVLNLRGVRFRAVFLRDA
ncbi:MAG: PD-(D/E)XK nuclease family protein, partial [Elusimicrobiota bacterium]